MAEIIFKDITKIFPNGKTAVRDFNLEINHGEFLVLAGPVGSGKTTVLRMIAGMEPITSGELKINGELVENMSPCKRNMGMIFRNFTLYPGMTVYDNIAFSMRLKDLPEEDIDAAVTRTAKIFKISNLLNCYPHELNELQKQYVAMARAHVHNPEAYLMLDVISSLEPRERGKARKRMWELYDEIHTTLVYATNDPTEAVKMGTRTVIMKRGRIEQAGTPEEIMNLPCSLYVAQFMNGRNFYVREAMIDKGASAIEAVDGTFSVDVPPEWEERLERGGYIGEKVLVGYTVSDPPDYEGDEKEEEDVLPEANSRFFFFDKDTEKTIL